ncbi:MAG: vWA domain-containing protein, partial [Anaerorhabdus sp.]
MKLTKFLLAFLIMISGLGFTGVSAVETSTQSNLRPSEGDEYAEGTINQYAVASDVEDEYDITIEITGKTEDPETADVVFVLDTSASMLTNGRLNKLKESVNSLASQLLQHENVNVAVVTFGDDLGNVLEFTSEYSEVSAFVDAIQAGGNTFTQAGLKKARELLEARPEETSKSLILVADGVANISYKVTGTADIYNDELRSYLGITPLYYVTSYDYDTTIEGTSPMGKNGYYQVEGTDDWVFNHAAATAGEVASLKNEGVSVYAVAVELPNKPSDEKVYNNTIILDAEKTGIEGTINTSWSEEIKDRMIEPGETVTMTIEYVNTSDKTDPLFKFRNLGFMFDKKYLLDATESLSAVYSINDVPFHTITTAKGFAEAAAPELLTNEVEDACVNVEPGSSCKLEITIKFNEFTPKTFVGSQNASIFYYFLQSANRTATLPEEDQATDRTGAIFVEFTNNSIGNMDMITPVFSFPELGAFSAYYEAEYLLRNVSSDGIDGSTYFDVDNSNNLETILSEEIYGNILKTIRGGNVEITMGEYATLINGAYDGEDFKIEGFKDGVASVDVAAGVTVASSATRSSSEVLSIDNVTLGEGETIKVTYRATLDTEVAGYVAGEAYPVNNTATFKATETSATADIRNLPIPKISLAAAYTITATAGAGGSISPEGATVVSAGGSQTYTITAATRYKVKDVLVDGVSVGAVDSYDFTNVTADHTIEVSFELNKFKITLTETDGGRTVVNIPNQGQKPAGEYEAVFGDEVAVFATPEDGYKVESITINGTVYPVTTPYGLYVIDSVEEDYVVHVIYAKDEHTITATAGAGGSISPAGDVVVAGNQNQSFAIVAQAGYAIEDVLVDGVSVGAVDSYDFTNVTADHTIEV